MKKRFQQRTRMLGLISVIVVVLTIVRSFGSYWLGSASSAMLDGGACRDRRRF